MWLKREMYFFEIFKVIFNRVDQRDLDLLFLRIGTTRFKRKVWLMIIFVYGF